VVNVLLILPKQADKVCVFSYRLAGEFKIVLS